MACVRFRGGATGRNSRDGGLRLATVFRLDTYTVII
jgi:hypothetical protein